MSLGRFLRRLYYRAPVVKELRALTQKVEELHLMLGRAALLNLQAQLAGEPRYKDPKRLVRYGVQTFSQNGEDGILDEIFRRIGTTSLQFVEIGVGNGYENNTMMLLLQGWTGWWIEGNPRSVAEISASYQKQIASGQLTLVAGMATAENITGMLTGARIPTEFDLLSIDIDRNTYWVWAALERLHPRVAVIEYNSIFPPQLAWKVEYHADKSWNGTSYMGASLKALELLGRKFGYALVGCDPMGVNAFFVREELCADHFAAPFTSENHYEPPRYGLIARMGHPPCFTDIDQ